MLHYKLIIWLDKHILLVSLIQDWTNSVLFVEGTELGSLSASVSAWETDIPDVIARASAAKESNAC